MPFLTPDIIQAAIAVVLFLGSALGVWWKVTARLHAFLDAQNATLAAVDKLRIQVSYSAKSTRERLDLFARDVNELKTRMAALAAGLGERERDVARLEGQIEQLGGLVAKQIGAMQGATASVDALWRTLQTLHPERVPKRASERGG